MEKRTKEGKAKKRDYISRYNAANYKQIKLNYHIINDQDILDQLENVKSKADYIRGLIRDDIKGNAGD